jgi:DNA-binding NarL/FixJ family response regulator
MLRLIRGRNSAPPLRVLILHDCAVSAERLTRELEQGGTKLVSHRVDSEGAFLQALRNFAPDIVLVASTLANFNARTALQLVQAHHPIAAVILVTEAFDEQGAVGCLRAGAENVVLENNLSRLAPATQKALAVRQPLRKLSRRQLQVLRLVAEGLTSREIAGGLGLAVKTVETHRSAGMRRLGIDDVPGLVRYAVRVGLIPQTLSSVESINGAGIRRVAASTHQSPLPAQSRGSSIASSSASKEPGWYTGE